MGEWDALIEDIKNLKKEKNAIILAHNYQRKEIYEIADFIGDSFALARFASEKKSKIVVFCGVDFMAETAKILSPESKVILPSKNATCPMANMITMEKLKELQKTYPKAGVISYVNTRADIKSVSYACCTSANAIPVVEQAPFEEIIFVPDYNLGRWIQKNTNKKIILFNAHCLVHSKITSQLLLEAKKKHPDAEVLSHPEAPMDVLEASDFVLGTGGMISRAKRSDSKEFIIVTEEGMINRLKREVPGKIFYSVGGVCFNMKKTTLENVYDALKNESNETIIDKDIAALAKVALDRMLKTSDLKNT